MAAVADASSQAEMSECLDFQKAMGAGDGRLQIGVKKAHRVLHEAARMRDRAFRLRKLAESLNIAVPSYKMAAQMAKEHREAVAADAQATGNPIHLGPARGHRSKSQRGTPSRCFEDLRSGSSGPRWGSRAARSRGCASRDKRRPPSAGPCARLALSCLEGAAQEALAAGAAPPQEAPPIEVEVATEAREEAGDMDAEVEESTLQMAFKFYTTDFVSGLLEAAVDDYTDEAVHEVGLAARADGVLLAETVLPAQEPTILEDEAEDVIDEIWNPVSWALKADDAENVESVDAEEEATSVISCGSDCALMEDVETEAAAQLAADIMLEPVLEYVDFSQLISSRDLSSGKPRRAAFRPRLSMRPPGPPVPEEPFPFDCLPLSQAVACSMAPAGEVAAMGLQEEPSAPFFASTAPRPLSEEATDLVFSAADNAWATLLAAAREEASATIQRRWRLHQAKQVLAKTKHEEVVTASTPVPASPEPCLAATAPVPPSSPKRGERCNARRRPAARPIVPAASESAIPTATAEEAMQPAIVPTAPSAPRPTRVGARPMGALLAAATAAPAAPQPPPVKPPSGPAPVAAAASPRRPPRLVMSSMEKSSEKVISSDGQASVMLRPPTTPKTPRTLPSPRAPRAAVAAPTARRIEEEWLPSAMELDLGPVAAPPRCRSRGNSRGPSPGPPVQKAAAELLGLGAPEALPPGTPRASGTGLLPALASQKVKASGSIAWSILGHPPALASVPKTIDSTNNAAF